MSGKAQLFTIHYADGRVDGPIGGLVVRDLIKAGVISDADQLSVGGAAPQPYGAFAEFADLGAGPPPPPSVRSVSGLKVPRRAAPSGASIPARSGPARTMPRVSSATPTSSGPPQGAATQVPAPPPSGAPPRLDPPAPPTTRSRTKENKFPDEWLAEGAENLRDRLLMATLPDILGVDLDDLSETVSRAYVSRAGQIGRTFAGTTETEGRLAVEDVLKILLRSQEILTESTLRAEYLEANRETGRVLSFQNHCMDFSFATEASLSPVGPASTSAGGSGMSRVPSRAATAGSSPGIRAARASSPNLKARMGSARGTSDPEVLARPAGAASVTSLPRRSILAGSNPSIPVSAAPPKAFGSGLPTIPSGDFGSASLDSVSLDADAPSLDGLFAPDQAAMWGSGDEDLFSQADEAPTAVGPPPIDPMGFPPEMIAQGPEALRDQLLMSSLPDVLGVGLHATADTLTHAYVARNEQAMAVKAASSQKEHQLAALDVRNILIETHSLMTDDSRRQAYSQASENAGRMLSFQNHIPFSFATEVELAIANADEATPRVPAGLHRPSQPISLLSGPTRARLQEAPVEVVKYKDKQELEAERARQEAAAQRRKEKKKKRSQFGSQFKGAEVYEEGDPFKGRLAFGVGKAGRGLLQVGIGFLIVFLISFALVSVGGFGVDELALEPTDRMLYIRAGLMSVIALGFLFAVRRENPLRIGLLPRWGVIIALPAAIGLAFIAGTIARFEINPNNTDLWGSLAVLLAIRAVGEGLFFHGFVTRTLLVEFKNPGAAVFLSAVLYGIYGVTYASLVQGGAFGAIYACFIYAFGGGFPFAVMYWKTRSTPALILVHFIVLMGSAAGGVAHATKFLN